jgi:hypothetical protein
VRCAPSLRLAAPIWCQRRLLMKLYSTENSEELFKMPKISRFTAGHISLEKIKIKAFQNERQLFGKGAIQILCSL